MGDYDAISLDTVASALIHIPAFDRDVWVKMAMAIKSEFGEAGYSTWDDWSATADNYQPKAALAVWRSVKPGGRVGIGTLIHIAKDNGFEFEKPELTAEQKAEQQKVIEQRKAAREQAEKEHAAWQEKWYGLVSEVCAGLFKNHLKQCANSPYLGEKRCKAHNIGFAGKGVIILVDEPEEKIHTINGAEHIRHFFSNLDYQQLKDEGRWFLYVKRGTIAIPLRDVNNKLWNIQFIFANGKKQFIKNGRKSGLFHLIGEPENAPALLIAEGYATGATIHEATALPMAIAFDAGNLKPVGMALREKYPDLPMVFCGDDDSETDGNPGRTKAEQAAKAVQGVAVFPEFKEAA